MNWAARVCFGHWAGRYDSACINFDGTAGRQVDLTQLAQLHVCCSAPVKAMRANILLHYPPFME